MRSAGKPVPVINWQNYDDDGDDDCVVAGNQSCIVSIFIDLPLCTENVLSYSVDYSQRTAGTVATTKLRFSGQFSLEFPFWLLFLPF